TASIGNLLAALQRLTPAVTFTASELKGRPKADEEFGFSAPQASVVLQQGDTRRQVLIGSRTAPGDQGFLQVVGVDSVYIVSADLLGLIPRAANDWRDTALLRIKELAFDHLAVTNGPTTFELARDATNRVWRMSAPIPARADNARIEDALT